jgi:hypothetical protein
MSIKGGRRSRGRYAPGGKFQNLDYLLLWDAKPLYDLIYRGSSFKIFENG